MTHHFKNAGNRRSTYGTCPFCKRHGLYATGLEHFSIKVHQIVCKYCRESEPVPEYDVMPDRRLNDREEFAYQMLCLRAYNDNPKRRRDAGTG